MAYIAQVSFSISYDQNATAFHFFTRTLLPLDSPASLGPPGAPAPASSVEATVEEVASSFIDESSSDDMMREWLNKLVCVSTAADQENEKESHS